MEQTTEETKQESKLKRVACEVYSRVTGYLRPITQWNDGKQAEFFHRKMFKLKKEEPQKDEVKRDEPTHAL